MTIAAANAGTGTCTASASSFSFDCGATFVQYDLVVVLVAADNAGTSGANSVSSVTDAKGHTYTRQVLSDQRTAGSVNDSGTLTIWTAEVAAAGMASTDDITVNFSPNTNRAAAVVLKVTPTTNFRCRFGATQIFDNFSTLGNGIVISGTMYVGQLLVCGVAGESTTAPSSDSDTTNGSWSTRINVSSSSGTGTSSQTVASQNKVQTTTSSTQNWGPLWGASCDWEAGTLVIYEAVKDTPATLTLTAVAGTVTPGGVTVTAQVGSLTFSTIAGVVTGGAASKANQIGSVALTAVPATVTGGPVTKTAQLGSLTFSTVAGVVTPGPVTVTAQVGDLVLTAEPGAFVSGSAIISQQGILALSGVDGALAGGNATVDAQIATLSLTGITPGTATPGNATIPAQIGALALSGIAGTTTGGAASHSAQVASITLSGIAGVSSGGAASFAAQTASLTLTGITPGTATPGGATVTRQVGNIGLEGGDTSGALLGTIVLEKGGTGTQTSSAGSFSFDCGVDFDEYDLCIVLVAADNAGTSGANSVSNVTDAKGHTYTRQVLSDGRTSGSVNDSGTLSIWTCQVGGAGMASTDDITVHFSPNTDRAAAVVVRAIAYTNKYYTVVDTEIFDANSDFGPHITNSIAANNALIFGLAGEQTTFPTSDTDTVRGEWHPNPNVPFSEPRATASSSSGSNTSSQTVFCQWKVVNATGTQNWGPVWGTACDWEAATLVLQENLATVPGAPTGLGATPNGLQSMDLSWTAPASNGFRHITDYVVEYALAGSGSWTTFSHAPSVSTSITVTGLLPGTSYDFRVSAVNSVGTGGSSTVTTQSTNPWTAQQATLTLTPVAGALRFYAPAQQAILVLTGVPTVLPSSMYWGINASGH